MKFFHPVTTFSTAGKTAKGKALQTMALQFDRVLIHGYSSAIKIANRMRMIAAQLDVKYPRTRPTFIDCHIDNEGNGQITACPASENGTRSLDKEYFRITFNTVAHDAVIDEILDKFIPLNP